MTGIDQVDTQRLGIPELIVADICRDKGVTSGGSHLLHFTGTGTAANGDFMYRLSAADIPKTLAAQRSFYPGKKIRKGLFLHGTLP